MFALPNQIIQEGLVAGAGIPPTGQINIRVRLFEAEQGGAPVYEEIHEGVPIVAGYYAIAIGSVEPLDATLFQQANLFLGISINDGVELAPRTAFRKVPASFFADTANNVVGDINPKTVVSMDNQS